MVRNLLNILHREVRGLHEAAYLLGFFALLSQILALFRDRLLAHTFGASTPLDLYYAAFRIPDVIFVAIASLVSFSVLIPFLAERTERSTQAGRELISNVFTIFFLAITVISGIVWVIAPTLLPALFPGFVESGNMEQLIALTRILLLQPILLGLSNLFASVTQIYQKFVLYAVSPLLYNIGIIFGVTVLYPALGLSGLAWGVVLGAVAHMSIQIPFLIKSGFFPRPSLRIRRAIRDVRSVVLLSLPRTAALSAQQIAILVLVSFASLLPAGSVAVFNLALNLQNVPLAIIGASYSVAAFPTLARFFANGEKERFFDHVTAAARHIIFWSLPVLALFIVLRAQIVRVILGAGEFGWTDTRLTAAALALFVISLTAHALVLLLVRGYYATGKTLRPLIANVSSAVLIVVSAYGFLKLFSESAFARFFIESLLRVEGLPGTEVLALPLGYALGMFVNVGLLLLFFHRDFTGFSKTLGKTFFESLSAAVAAGFAAHQALNVLDDVFNVNTVAGIFGQGAIAGVVGIAVGILVLSLLKNTEIREAWNAFHRKFWRRRPIAAEESDL